MTKKFNRKYKAYQPDAQAGPPTERICKPVKCHTDDGTTPPNPPTPPAPTP